MKSSISPTLILATLIGGALLSLGIRARLDARREAAALESLAGKKENLAAKMERRQLAPRTNLEPGSVARKEALFQRLRGALVTANAIDRERAILLLIDDLEPAEFPLVMEGIEQQRMSPNGYNWAAMEMLAAWAAVDPVAAVLWEIRWGEKQGLGDNTDHPTRALEAWLLRDSEAAEKWCQAHPDKVQPTLLDFVKRQMASSESESRAKRLASGDLDKALATLHGSTGDERRQLASSITEQVLQRGPELIRQWLGMVEDPALRTEVLAMVISRNRVLPASERIELYRQHPELGARISVGSLYGAYARENEEAALAGFDEQPDGPEKLKGVSAFISALSEYPALPGTAVKVMDRYPEAVTDAMMVRWMDMLGNSTDIPAYLAQLPRIRSEELRNQTRRTILTQWIRSEPEAAREWLDHHEIPEPLRQELEGRQ